MHPLPCASLCEYRGFRYVVSFKTRQQTVPEIEKLYWRKWFEDINGRIVALVREPLDAELKDIEMLENRYAQTIDEMDAEIAAAEKELEAMQGELVVG